MKTFTFTPFKPETDLRAHNVSILAANEEDARVQFRAAWAACAHFAAFAVLRDATGKIVWDSQRE